MRSTSMSSMRSTSMSSRALLERGLHREAWWGQHREALGRALASAPEVFYSLPMLPVSLSSNSGTRLCTRGLIFAPHAPCQAIPDAAPAPRD
jgi:hypothetical protein